MRPHKPLVRVNVARKYKEAIAERERLTRESLALRRRFVLAEEEERRQVAQELRDGAGQRVTAVSLGLLALSELTPPGSDVNRRAAQLRVLVNITGQELHALAVRLRPKALEEFGLAAAIEEYSSAWARQTGIALELHMRIGAARLSAEVETAVYRIVHEALTNVAKHSGAGGASLAIERRHGAVCLAIADDGRGFDTRTLSRPEDVPGLGLPVIRERAALLDGWLDVESAPGEGTTLSIRIPVDIMSPGGEPIGGDGGSD